MSFWNNPENNSIKMVLIIIIVFIAGYFVYAHLNSGNKGQVINMQPSASVQNQAAASNSTGNSGVTFSTTVSGTTCSMNVCSAATPNQCIALSGTVAKDGSCALDQKQETPQEQGLLSIINSGSAATK